MYMHTHISFLKCTRDFIFVIILLLFFPPTYSVWGITLFPYLEFSSILFNSCIALDSMNVL